jgi:hypothetical protein
MTKQQIPFIVPVVSKDKKKAKVKVTMSAGPSEENLFGFIKYGDGKLEPVLKDAVALVSQQTESEASDLDLIPMCQKGSSIAGNLYKHIKENDAKDNFFLDITQIRTECELPDEIATAMNKVTVAQFEGEELVKRTEAFNKSVDVYVESSGKHGPKTDHASAVKQVNAIRLIGQNNIKRIQLENLESDNPGGKTGNKQNITVTDLHVNFGNETK